MTPGKKNVSLGNYLQRNTTETPLVPYRELRECCVTYIKCYRVEGHGILFYSLARSSVMRQRRERESRTRQPVDDDDDGAVGQK